MKKRKEEEEEKKRLKRPARDSDAMTSLPRTTTFWRRTDPSPGRARGQVRPFFPEALCLSNGIPTIPTIPTWLHGVWWWRSPLGKAASCPARPARWKEQSASVCGR